MLRCAAKLYKQVLRVRPRFRAVIARALRPPDLHAMNMGARMLKMRRSRLTTSSVVCTAWLHECTYVWCTAPKTTMRRRLLASQLPIARQNHPPTRMTVNGKIRGTIGRQLLRGKPSRSSDGPRPTATRTGLTYQSTAYVIRHVDNHTHSIHYSFENTPSSPYFHPFWRLEL